MIKHSALVVVGSMNEENDFGVKSGQRVAGALRSHDWAVTVANSAAPREVIGLMLGGRFDAIVPVGFGLHSGEDGSIYTLSKLLGLPCAGPGPICGGICTDKSLFQHVVRGIFPSGHPGVDRLQVRTPTTFLVTHETPLDTLVHGIESLPLPIVLKPAYGGSSIGISVAKTHREAIALAKLSRDSAGRLLAQEHISAREISATLIDLPDRLHVCPLVELKRGGALIMGYEEKFGITANARHVIPAPFPAEITTAIKRVVVRLHSAIGLCGVSRVDALIDEEKSEMIVLEANPIAGMLECSIATDAARADGIDFETLAELYALTAFRPRQEPKCTARRVDSAEERESDATGD